MNGVILLCLICGASFLSATEKRMPASILIQSPWFQSHEISCVDDASKLTKRYLDETYPPLT